MSITITDIASITGFSISTVSKALSNSTDVSEKSRAAILKCAVETGYLFGRKKQKNAGTIAAVVEGMDHTDTNRFEYQMLFGFQLASAAAGYNVEIIQKPLGNNPWDYADNVFKKGYEGVFLMRLTYSPESIRDIKDASSPIIMFDYSIDRSNVSFVGCDNEAGIHDAVNHLVSLGHKNIAFYGGTPMSQVSIERKSGFIKACRENGLHVYPELIFESDFTINYAASIVPKILDGKATAIVCASDLLAQYVITQLHSMGLSVPGDISVTGFDNVPLAEEISPKLTTVSQNSVELGRSAFYVLKKLMKGIHISKLLYRTTLIVRESSGPAPVIKKEPPPLTEEAF